eukprot:2058743-Rhodomonas_salina.1
MRTNASPIRDPGTVTRSRLFSFGKASCRPSLTSRSIIRVDNSTVSSFACSKCSSPTPHPATAAVAVRVDRHTRECAPLLLLST